MRIQSRRLVRSVIGETVSHYRIGERLGEGGMGVVYRAQDVRLGRPVAVKFLSEAAGRNLGALDRFLREARVKLDELGALARQRYVSPFDMATVHAERSYLMPSLGALFVFDALRSEPRFQALLRGMDLPSLVPASAP